jgi:hypothetical protein
VRRLVGFAFVFEEPVRGGYMRLGDVTVLAGPNDTGKTRVLSLIETSLMGSPLVEGVDVYGLGSEEEVAALVDPDVFDYGSIGSYADALGPLIDDLEVDDGDEVRVGVRLHFSGGMSAFRFGRAPAELDTEACEEVMEALPHAAGSGDPREPVKLEYLGEPDASVFPKAVVVPQPGRVITEQAGALVFRLARTFQEAANMRAALEMRGGRFAEVDDALFRSFIEGPPPEQAEQWWRWLVRERRQASTVDPAAVAACDALERIVNGLLPEFIADEYRIEITPGQPTEMAQGRFAHLQLMRLDTQDVDEELDGDEPSIYDPDPDAQGVEDLSSRLPQVAPADGALRFAIDDAPAGFVVWLQLAVHEAIRRAEIISYRLEIAVRRLSQIDADGDRDHPEVLRSLDEVLAEPREWDDEPDNPDYEQYGLDRVRREVEELFGYLRAPTVLAPGPDSPLSDEQLRPYPDFDMPAVVDIFADPVVRVYLIDEPEQRLHPALQRRAARWLSTAMRQWDAQCVLATHSIAFIDIPGEREVYELVRDGQQSELRLSDGAPMTPATPLARALGLDRGELLTRYRLFVLLDEDLAATLGELVGDRLDKAHIRLIATPEQQAIQPIIATLGALTAAPIVAVTRSMASTDVDNPASDVPDRLQQDAPSPAPQTVSRHATLTGDAYPRNIELLTVYLPDVVDRPPRRSPPRCDAIPGAEPTLPTDQDPLLAPPVEDLVWELEQRAWGADL